MADMSQRRQMYRRQLSEQWLRENLPMIWDQVKHAADVMAAAKRKEQPRGRDATDRRRAS